jgi:N6-adenosine-specific RNA methylase IME4
VRARVLVADPAWKFTDTLPKGRDAMAHYRTITLDEIKTFPLPEMEEDSVLFLWRVSSQPQEALDVVRAWGFEPKSELVWVKTNGEDKLGDDGEVIEEATTAIGMGRITRGAHETCIIATRGKAYKHVADKGVRTVFRAPRLEHSRKPDKFFEIVERLFPLSPDHAHVELFARRHRPGWSCFGDELDVAHPGAERRSGEHLNGHASHGLDDSFVAGTPTEDDVDEADCRRRWNMTPEEADFSTEVATREELVRITKLPLCSICLHRQWMTAEGITCVLGHAGAPSTRSKDVSHERIVLAVARSWNRAEVHSEAELSRLELPGEIVEEVVEPVDRREVASAGGEGAEPRLFRGAPLNADGSATVDGARFSPEYVAAELRDEQPAPLPAEDEVLSPLAGAVCVGNGGKCTRTPVVRWRGQHLCSDDFAAAKGGRSAASAPALPEVKKKGQRQPKGFENFSTDVDRLSKATGGKYAPTLVEWAGTVAARRREGVAWLDALDAASERGEELPPPPKFVSKAIGDKMIAIAVEARKSGVDVAPTDVEQGKLVYQGRKGKIIADEEGFAELVAKAPKGWIRKTLDAIRGAASAVPEPQPWEAARRLVEDRWEEFAPSDDLDAAAA